ncbi:opioid growth factor receptor-related protein [Endozoicomonas numazuensis]|uniref:opioid growth factor receptor-related protein n=1 Tax=Endozoicomonas numazuensis TaxID=1137799 RepID=UPI001377E094|nr:opioid growth factor receptor-related protein [Endozoicomonas numazuensis]
MPDGVYEYDEMGSHYWQGATLGGFNSYQTSIAGSYLESLQILIPAVVVMSRVSKHVPYAGVTISLSSLGLAVADYVSVVWEGWSLAANKHKSHDLIYPIPFKGKDRPPLLILLVVNAFGPHYEIYSLWKEEADEKYKNDEYLQLAKSLTRYGLSLKLSVREVSGHGESSRLLPSARLLPSESFLDISLIDTKQNFEHYQTFTASSPLPWLDTHLPSPDENITGDRYQSALEPKWIEHITLWMEENHEILANKSLVLTNEFPGPELFDDLGWEMNDSREVDIGSDGCLTVSFGSHSLSFDQNLKGPEEVSCLSISQSNNTSMALYHHEAYNQYQTQATFFRDKVVKKAVASAVSFSAGWALYHLFKPSPRVVLVGEQPALTGRQPQAVLPAALGVGSGVVVVHGTDTVPVILPVPVVAALQPLQTFGQKNEPPVTPHFDLVRQSQGGDPPLKEPGNEIAPGSKEPVGGVAKPFKVVPTATVTPSKAVTATVKATAKPTPRVTPTPVRQLAAQARGSYPFKQSLLKERPRREALPNNLVRKDFPVFAHDETKIYPGQTVALKDVLDGNLATVIGPEPGFGSAARARFLHERLQFVLEKEHSYIQQLFPIWDNKSTPNPKAPLLTKRMIENIQSDPVLLQKVTAHIDMMIDFWGLRRIGDTFEVVHGLDNRHKKWTQADHNLRRVTRLITFLASVGFKTAAQNLEKTMNGYRRSANTFWSKALSEHMRHTDKDLFLRDYGDGVRSFGPNS